MTGCFQADSSLPSEQAAKDQPESNKSPAAQAYNKALVITWTLVGMHPKQKVALHIDPKPLLTTAQAGYHHTPLV